MALSLADFMSCSRSVVEELAGTVCSPRSLCVPAHIDFLWNFQGISHAPRGEKNTCAIKASRKIARAA